MLIRILSGNKLIQCICPAQPKLYTCKENAEFALEMEPCLDFHGVHMADPITNPDGNASFLRFAKSVMIKNWATH